jgi:anti-sigma B factor antagonist
MTMPGPQLVSPPTLGQLTIGRRSDADSVTLVLRGEVDIASAPMLEAALREVERSRPRRIVLDLAALDFVDSTGVHLLINAQERARAQRHELVLTRVPSHAQRLFDLTGVSAQLTLL